MPARYRFYMGTTPGLQFTVYGTAAPQGSKQGFVPTRRDGTPVRRQNGSLMVNIVDDNPAGLSTWRREIVMAAKTEMAGRGPMKGPVRLSVVFTLAKPASATAEGRTWPFKKPDLDKLVRAVGDALKTAGVYQDDAQVVQFGDVGKSYPRVAEHSLDSPGAWIWVCPVSSYTQWQTQQTLL